MNYTGAMMTQPRDLRVSVLRIRQLVPPLTIHTPDGRSVRAWDYKQKKNLVIAFLDTDCEPCESFLQALASSAASLNEKDAVALVVFLEQPARRLTDALPAGIIVGSDIPGNSARAFLGDDAFASRGFVCGGVFVTDRYGELFAQWIIERHKFPSIAATLTALDHAQMACEECGTPLWTSE
jgi:hypothetical protein